MTSFPLDDYPRRTGESPAGGAYDGIRWRGGEIAIGSVAVVVTLFVLVGITSIILSLAGFPPESPEELVLTQVLLPLLLDATIVLIVFRLANWKGSGWLDLGLKSPAFRVSGSAVLGLALVIPLGWFIASSGVQIYAITVKALGVEVLQPSGQLSDEIFDYNGILIGFAIVGVTIVPFAEELFFRGFFFAGLRRRVGFLLAALISGLIFSLAHNDIGLIIPFTFVGMVLAYSYERTGSLYAPVGIHVLFNLVSFLVLILVPEARNN